MQVIELVFSTMGRAWDILFNDFVIYTEPISGVGVTFGAVILVLIVLFYVIYKVVGS